MAPAWLLESVEVIVGAGAATFDEAVRPHLAAMWVLATRLAGSNQREDVVQEALVNAWRRWSTYDEQRGTVRTWLLVLVADRCRKAWRAQRPTLELVDRAGPAADHDAQLDLTRAVTSLPKR